MYIYIYILYIYIYIYIYMTSFFRDWGACSDADLVISVIIVQSTNYLQ